MRGSDPDAAVYWLARMLEAGEDARFIARRMIIFASEDVGLADAGALTIAVAAAQAVEHVGLPEAHEEEFPADEPIWWCERTGEALGPDGSEACRAKCPLGSSTTSR